MLYSDIVNSKRSLHTTTNEIDRWLRDDFMCQNRKSVDVLVMLLCIGFGCVLFIFSLNIHLSCALHKTVPLIYTRSSQKSEMLNKAEQCLR